MARRPRGFIEAGDYHVTTRSAGMIPMFLDDIDRTDFCNRLRSTIARRGWRCHAFVLMTTHFHLLLDVEEERLQPGMHWLNGTYAQQFNRRSGRWGHLTGARYFSVAVESDRHQLGCFRYIALNPVEAGLCKQPQDWLWSSYRGTAGYGEQFDFVDDSAIRAYFGDGPRGTERLRAFVEEAVTAPRRGLSPGGVAGL
jgi:REP element-mobilizing transposase RayT